MIEQYYSTWKEDTVLNGDDPSTKNSYPKYM